MAGWRNKPGRRVVPHSLVRLSCPAALAGMAEAFLTLALETSMPGRTGKEALQPLEKLLVAAGISTASRRRTASAPSSWPGRWAKA